MAKKTNEVLEGIVEGAKTAVDLAIPVAVAGAAIAGYAGLASEGPIGFWAANTMAASTAAYGIASYIAGIWPFAGDSRRIYVPTVKLTDRKGAVLEFPGRAWYPWPFRRNVKI